MLSPRLLLAFLSSAAVGTTCVSANNNGQGGGGASDYSPLQPLSIYAYGINATFISRGATITHLYVHDRDNNPRDVVLGYDDPADYPKDTATNHTFFGAIVG